MVHRMSQNNTLAVDRLRLRIIAYMMRNKLSARQMAARAGITEIALRRLKTEAWNPRANTMRQLERAIRPAPLDGAANQTRLSA